MRSKVSDRPYAGVGRPRVLAGVLVVAALSTWPALGLRPTSYDLGLLGLLGLAIVLALRTIERERVYPYVVTLLLSLALGHIGLMVGLAADFGPVGLLMLASWCSGVGDGEGLRMFAAAPWGHVGMLIGCNVGMLMAGCGRLAKRGVAISGPVFLMLCNLGMIAGMVALAGVTDLPPGSGLAGIAGVKLVEMSFGMIGGMLAVWWLVQHRSGPHAMHVAVLAGKEKD